MPMVNIQDWFISQFFYIYRSWVCEQCVVTCGGWVDVSQRRSSFLTSSLSCDNMSSMHVLASSQLSWPFTARPTRHNINWWRCTVCQNTVLDSQTNTTIHTFNQRHLTKQVSSSSSSLLATTSCPYFSLLYPPGGIAIHNVCCLVRLVLVCPLTFGQWLHWLAGVRVVADAWRSYAAFGRFSIYSCYYYLLLLAMELHCPKISDTPCFKHAKLSLKFTDFNEISHTALS